MSTRRRLLLSPLLLLVALVALATVLTAGTVSASAGHGPDTRVSAFDPLTGNSGAGVNSYSYDYADRLVSWTDPSVTTRTYTWDKAGNLINAAGVVQSFDERNRLSATGTTTYTWSARGTIDTVTTGATVTGYTFDGFDRLASKGSTSFTYDGLDRLANANGVANSYDGLEPKPAAIGTTTIVRDPNGRPWVVNIPGSGSGFVGLTRHGDLGYLQDVTGTLTGSQVFDPFGNITSTAGAALPLGFQADYMDPTDGSTWMGARWYTPGTAAFESRDTIHGGLTAPVSLNRYSYGLDNPVSLWDPDGHRAANACQGADLAKKSSDALFEYAQALDAQGGAAGCEMKALAHAATSLARGVIDGFTFLPKLAIHAASDFGNCMTDQILDNEHHGCFTTIAHTARGLTYAVNHPKTLVRACTRDINYCIGGLIGSVAFGMVAEAAAPIAVAQIARFIEPIADEVQLAIQASNLPNVISAITTQIAKINTGLFAQTTATEAGPDFVAGPIGSEPPVPVSQSRMAAGFDEAGFPSTPTASPGTEYTLPDGTKVRLMEPSGQAPMRASFTNANGGPINPFTGKPVQPPAPAGWSMRDWVRALTHVEQTP